jgi:hypothetical protein
VAAPFKAEPQQDLADECARGENGESLAETPYQADQDANDYRQLMITSDTYFHAPRAEDKTQ